MSDAADPTPEVTLHAHTDVGRVREANEDSLFVGRHLLAVADGMGGHVAGEVASASAIEPVAEADEDLPDGDDEAVARVVEAVREANRRVAAKSRDDEAYEGMGTTLTVALLRDGRAHLCHVGDSRAYLLRPGRELLQLTTDHTLVEELIREGRLTREEAEVHPHRGMITRAIGVDDDVSVDTVPDVPLRDGDQLLLCSDGLTGMLDEPRIAELLRDEPDGERACRRLIDEANAAGGTDNITVVLARIGEPADDVPADATGRLVTPPVAPPADEAETPPPPALRPAGDQPARAGATGGGADGATIDRPDDAAAGPGGDDAGDEEHDHDRGAADGDEHDRAGGAAGDDEPAARPIRTLDERADADWADSMGRLGASPGASRPPLEPERRVSRGSRAAAVVLALVLLVVVLGGGGWWMLSRSHYVGVADDGQVAIFNGLPRELVGVRAGWVAEPTDLEAAELSSFRRERLERGVPVGSLGEAEALVADLEAEAAERRAERDEAFDDDDDDPDDEGGDA